MHARRADKGICLNVRCRCRSRWPCWATSLSMISRSSVASMWASARERRMWGKSVPKNSLVSCRPTVTTISANARTIPTLTSKESNKSAKLSKHQQKINTNDHSITRSALNQNYCTIRSPCGYYATGGFWRFDQWHTTQQANKGPQKIV